MSVSVREVLPDVRELSGGPHKCLGVVGRPSRMSGSGLEALRYVREYSGDSLSYPGMVGGPPGCPGAVGRASRMTGSGREALLVIWEWSGGPPGYLGVVGGPSRMSGSCREALPYV